MIKKVILALLALLLALGLSAASFAQAAPAGTVGEDGQIVIEDSVAATVNGDEIMMSELYAKMNYFLMQLQQNGMDTSDTDTIYYIANVAMSALVQDRLLTQDMTKVGAYNFTEEENAALTRQAAEVYARLLSQLEVNYRQLNAGVEMTDEQAAEGTRALAEQYGYTIETVLNQCINQAASDKYRAWLMEGEDITDEKVQAEYEANVEQSKKAYAQDIAAFEQAVNSGSDIWYVPEGYRSVLQIMLLSDAEDKLADKQSVVDEIYSRLEKGEDFKTLIAEYGQDEAMTEGRLLNTGYMVHQDSTIFNDAFKAAVFADEMQKPGDYAKAPFVSDKGVHIVYYMADHASGAAELTDELREAMRTTLFEERADEKVTERLKVLQEEASIILAGAEEAAEADAK